MKVIFALAIALFFTLQNAESASWDYTDPMSWNTDPNFPECGKQRQSPIDIKKQNVVEDPSLHRLQAVNYNVPRQGEWEVSNNGHSLKVTPMVNVSGLSDPHNYVVFNHMAYELAQFHFHWGPNDTVGSEHTIDGTSYPAEVHFVHFNKKYGSLGDALTKSDGLLVWGHIFVVDNTQNNTILDKILVALPQVMYSGNKTTIPYFPPLELFPAKWDMYFNYPGSLTTPTCDQTVNWFVNQEPIKISSYQLSLLRTMYADTVGASMISTNYRPVQELHGREVKAISVDKSFKNLVASGWDYVSADIGEAQWPALFPICNENLTTSRQSPIDIKSKDTLYNNQLKPLTLVDYNKADSNQMTLSNNGHTLVLSMTKFPAQVQHQGNTYELAQYHFHWGKSKKEGGSEHTHDGTRFFAEVHFVHYNKKYGTLGNAVTKSDGLLVWGHFIQAKNGTADHAGWKKILDSFPDAANKGQSTQVAYVPPNELIPPMHNDYYTYLGSLTTPRCFESVTWIVNRDIIDISVTQMDQFLNIYKDTTGTKKMYNNYRKVQNLNSREVHKNFGGDDKSAGIFVKSSAALTIVLASILMWLSM